MLKSHYITNDLKARDTYYRPTHRACDFLYLGLGSFWCAKYFKYSYILVNESTCEELMKVTRIIVEIWAHLLF